MEIITKNAKETKKEGSRLAEKIIKTKKSRRSAFVIALEGDLGSGKTTFVQGMAEGFGVKERITSPTFVIMKKYPVGSRCFYHIDCYRLNSPKDILDLGFKEIVGQPENLVVIEWAEKIKNVLPKNALWLKFEYIDKNKRAIHF